jgi:succinylglutamate desuccinylase
MKILLNILTHGDETIGIAVAKELQKLKIKQNVLSIQRANTKAYGQNKRYIDQDLNRSFPGKKPGNHEQMLALLQNSTKVLCTAFRPCNLNMYSS